MFYCVFPQIYEIFVGNDAVIIKHITRSINVIFGAATLDCICYFIVPLEQFCHTIVVKRAIVQHSLWFLFKKYGRPHKKPPIV